MPNMLFQIHNSFLEPLYLNTTIVWDVGCNEVMPINKYFKESNNSKIPGKNIWQK
ncbi:hypothetical protein JHK86_055692 [Glycine max]|nr:hypothetical protein JHK86_055692 [Glycine max]